MNAREILLRKCAIQESLYYNKMHRYLFNKQFDAIYIIYSIKIF